MRLTVKSIYQKKKKREKIVALTAYDSLFADLLDSAGVDVLLVGDSVGMVLLGFDSTVPVTLRDMLHHTKAVARARPNALIVADMPYGSYDTVTRALRSAKRLIQEGGADAVKLEGGQRIERQVKALVRAGIQVMGHLGMTPQTAGALGGYRVQGKHKAEADKILRDAVRLDRLGVFSLVLECVPAVLAGRVTKKVKCPTIGIGAGVKTDGQILVMHDMLGLEGKIHPRFVRAYAKLSSEVRRAVRCYRKDVLAGKFPSKTESF
ncbi:MAG: 3-methyl-2-oxobutanoate hydroxymethyltransferase [Candidatus Omnitrophota bacterium]|nr:3-methyl-2-oxobutanoate hydroxymethyltransferase [Candidatus Omnitrophota bacterium]